MQFPFILIYMQFDVVVKILAAAISVPYKVILSPFFFDLIFKGLNHLKSWVRNPLGPFKICKIRLELKYLWKIFCESVRTLAGLDVSYTGEWSLWKPFKDLSINFLYADNFLQFWSRMILNKLDKNIFFKLVQ